MVHDFNSRVKKQEQVVKMNKDSQMKNIKNNILSSINPAEDETLNIKQITVKNFQNENEKLRQKCERLERRAKYQSEHNDLAQYGPQNNVVLSGIAEFVSDDTLKESVISVLADIDGYMEHQDIEAWHRFGKADRQKSKKAIVRFTNGKNCKKFLSNKKKKKKKKERKKEESTTLATIQKFNTHE